MEAAISLEKENKKGRLNEIRKKEKSKQHRCSLQLRQWGGCICLRNAKLLKQIGVVQQISFVMSVGL